ncbi:hypothetical protein PRZ48_015050 [Zasmidium cellare]|uniref:Sulfotransferase n=1 Tax=Zasmidium cellare TaxID=395010 RepID=A0ABR0DXL2_ZASCE|nr:hypothetical protein PRZ48_015050 [Zasmidium cellare]
MLDALFGIIFRPQPVPPQIRQKDLQVLALGLSRTGTESLKRALETLGYHHVYHGFDFLKQPNQVLQWVPLLERKIDGKRNFTASDFDAVTGHCEAVSDLPCSALYAELIDAYPKARIIVNYRKNVDDWYQSYAHTVDPLVTNWLYSFLCHFDFDAYWARRLVCRVQEVHYSGDFLLQGKEGYENHYVGLRAKARASSFILTALQ